MRRRVLNIFLCLAFIATLALHAVIGRDPSRRNYEILPEMVRTPAYDSYAPNPNFTDGATFQSPIPGTIARGQMPFHYDVTPQEAARAGKELKNPFSVDDRAARERGAVVFANYCQICHGPEGKGNGPLTQHGYPIPTSLVTLPKDKKDGELFHVISFGSVQPRRRTLPDSYIPTQLAASTGPPLTQLFWCRNEPGGWWVQWVPGNMPGHARQLSPDDRWKVVLHIRELQNKPAGENKP